MTYSSFDNSIGEWRHSRIAQHRVRCLSLRWCLLAQVSRAKLKLDNMPLPIRYAAETDARKHHESLSRDSSCGEDANKKMSWRKTKRKSKDKKAKRAALRAEATTSQCLGETLACEAQLETARNNSRSCQKELRLAHQQRDVTALEMLKIQDLYDEILERVHRELSPRSCQEELRLAHQQRDMTALEMLRIQNLYDEISERVHLELLPQLRDQRQTGIQPRCFMAVSWQRCCTFGERAATRATAVAPRLVLLPLVPLLRQGTCCAELRQGTCCAVVAASHHGCSSHHQRVGHCDALGICAWDACAACS